jgi:N-acetyltransferase
MTGNRENRLEPQKILLFRYIPRLVISECGGLAMNFDLQPTLRGGLIDLCPLRPDDFESLFLAASDPLIWEQHPESDRYKREVFQRFFDSAIESRGAFAVIDRASGRLIGSSRYCNFDPVQRQVEIGWTFLAREFWGGAYNHELKKLMLDHAFQFVDQVVFVVGEANLRSQKALQKIGAALIGKKDATARDGTVIPCLIFGISSHFSRIRQILPTGM